MSAASDTIARWVAQLPRSVNLTVHRLAIASLITQIGIIVTGGAVRLTKSGLGCSQWPNCVPGSMTPTPEMGIHGLIEFGNRTLTFVLLAVAIAFLLAVWNMRHSHRTIFTLAWVLLAGIPFQGVIGGITVWTKLNPWVVSLHFLLSSTLVALATILVNRTARELKDLPSPVQDRNVSVLAWPVWILSMIAIVLGTIVTGTGPHAGDASAPRHAFDALLVTRMHAAPVYLLIGATLVMLFLAHKHRADRLMMKALYLLVAAILVQGAIGYTQHFLALPIGLVILHMIGSALLISASTNVWDRALQLPKTQRIQ